MAESVESRHKGKQVGLLACITPQKVRGDIER
jgi:hypothetical protein